MSSEALFPVVKQPERKAVAQPIETLRYKPEGRGFDSGWRHWNFCLALLIWD
jgi:hypothetical protein